MNSNVSMEQLVSEISNLKNGMYQLLQENSELKATMQDMMVVIKNLYATIATSKNPSLIQDQQTLDYITKQEQNAVNFAANQSNLLESVFKNR